MKKKSTLVTTKKTSKVTTTKKKHIAINSVEDAPFFKKKMERANEIISSVGLPK